LQGIRTAHHQAAPTVVEVYQSPQDQQAQPEAPPPGVQDQSVDDQEVRLETTELPAHVVPEVSGLQVEDGTTDLVQLLAVGVTDFVDVLSVIQGQAPEDPVQDVLPGRRDPVVLVIVEDLSGVRDDEIVRLLVGRHQDGRLTRDLEPPHNPSRPGRPPDL